MWFAKANRGYGIPHIPRVKVCKRNNKTGTYFDENITVNVVEKRIVRYVKIRVCFRRYCYRCGLFIVVERSANTLGSL